MLGGFKAADLTTIHIGGEATTSAIRQALGTFFHLHKRVSPGLIENASHHARGRKRD
jgi:hypothetical protein